MRNTDIVSQGERTKFDRFIYPNVQGEKYIVPDLASIKNNSIFADLNLLF